MSSQFTEDRALWIYIHYLWLEEHLPERSEAQGRRDFVLPNKAWFPEPFRRDHTGAEALFRRIQQLMGMAEWDCVLEQSEDVDQRTVRALGSSGMLGQWTFSGAAGTYQQSRDRKVLITYSESLLADPAALVATLAHELCHYLLAGTGSEPPCGWKQLEPLTDLSAVVEGFGVFLCNSAFSFSQFTSYDSQGWSYKRAGYLTEAELGFSLAVFTVRNRLDPGQVVHLLKPNPREVYCDALDYVAGLEEAQPEP
jgi:hypothetical protein